MNPPRTGARRALAGAAFASLAFAAGAQPAAYPAKPIQLIAQQPPGSASDAMTRAWADCAAREMGQPVVVQNKPGANGILAVNALKSQPADGYTLMTIGMSQMTITPYVYRQPPYDPLHDFDSVAVLGSTPLVLAVPAGLGTLNAATEKCRSGDASYRARMEAMNVTLAASVPGDARTWAARDTSVWKPLIDKLGLATE